MPPPFLTVLSTFGAGGADLRKTEHRPKQAKRALQPMANGLGTAPGGTAAFGDSWPTEKELETLQLTAAQLHCVCAPADAGEVVLAARS